MTAPDNWNTTKLTCQNYQIQVRLSDSDNVIFCIVPSPGYRGQGEGVHSQQEDRGGGVDLQGEGGIYPQYGGDHQGERGAGVLQPQPGQTEPVE